MNFDFKKDDKNTCKNTNFITSFSYAIDGIIHTFNNERNFRTDIVMAILIALVSLLFDISKIEMAILSIAICFVLISELINTAIENCVNLIYKRYDPLCKIAKDVAAGAVLLSAFNALFVGYFIFYNRITSLSHMAIIRLQKSPIHLSFIALILVVLLVLILKAKFSKYHGTYLQGGTVSGHSAVSFCCACIVSFISNNTIVTILSMFLALLVAESRVEGKIHSLSEVIIGGLVGILVAVIIFKVVLL